MLYWRKKNPIRSVPEVLPIHPLSILVQTLIRKFKHQMTIRLLHQIFLIMEYQR